jgi:Na+-transporting NADH:ubiquinone oxidoreductase subunit A
MTNFSLKRGLDIPILGSPEQKIYDGRKPKTLAVMGTDFKGLKPKMLISEGDKVEKGTPLFCHKDFPEIIFVSPCKGYVESINRGERRILLSVVIAVQSLSDNGTNYIKLHNKPKSEKEFVKKCLLDSGLWSSFLTRPYSKIPPPNSEPSSIFITAIDTEPLCPDVDLIINNNFDAFEEGVKKISLLTKGEIFICKKKNSQIKIKNFETFSFDGPHPAGLAGTHMHFLDPPNSTKTVWSIGYQDVIAIGKLFLTGFLNIERIISICGPLAKSPRLIKTYMGASLNDLLENEFLNDDPCRIISGSVLSGNIAEDQLSFLGRYSRQITLIKEDKEKISFGWIKPQPNKFSVMPVLISALKTSKLFNLTSNLNGGRRAMVPTGIFETLMPQDFLPTQLLRSLIVMDTDVAQSLGALELDEEDLALVTFACPAKYEYGSALRDSLEKIEKEG